MPIEGIKQPNIIEINEDFRLRKFDGKFDFAYDWYQDDEIVYLVDHVRVSYTYEKLERMYLYLNSHYELYFIEYKQKPIGDVAFSNEDMPIVIGNSNFRGKHVGRLVIQALINRARDLGYQKLYVDEIYHENIASQKCFESLGFHAYQKTENGHKYCLELED